LSAPKNRKEDESEVSIRSSQIRAYHAVRSRGLPSVLRYAVAVALVMVALTLSLILQIPFGNPSWFFFPAAVLAATWIAGTGPGWIAVVLSTLAAQYFFIPPFRSWILQPRDVPFFLSFAACEIAANRLIAWRNRTEESLQQARDELEIRVADRTAELKDANDSLHRQMVEQRRTEDALQAARAELARIARITMVGELAASIAHEVNQPLAAVVANADACIAWLALERPNLNEAKAAADRAIQGATRASETIARIRSLINKGVPQRVPVALNQVIGDTVGLLKGQATRNHASVVTVLDPKLPAVPGDKVQLQQVILNLIINGIEAMTTTEQGGRQLTIRSEVLDGGQVRISIGDSGIGLAEELLTQVFEPFFTTRAEGVGMGLAISRSIVEAHGGRLWAESVINEGSVRLLRMSRAHTLHMRRLEVDSPFMLRIVRTQQMFVLYGARGFALLYPARWHILCAAETAERSKRRCCTGREEIGYSGRYC
jgi:signal transduction histidine kinase